MKRIFTLSLLLVMLLGILPAMELGIFADFAQQITIEPMDGGIVNTVRDGEAVTQLIMRITDQNGAILNLPKDYDFAITIEDSDYFDCIFLNPVAVANGIYYFEPVQGQYDEQFIPEKGKSYVISVTITNNDATETYMSGPALFSCTEDPILPWEEDEANLALTPEAPVWQLNKDKALQLVVRIEDLDGNAFVAPEGSEWGAIIGKADDEEFLEIVALTPISHDNGVYVFYVESDASSNPFRPQKGAEYILSLSVYAEDGEVAYYSDDTNGFVCPTDLYADSKNDDDNKGNIPDGTDGEKDDKMDDKKGIPTWLLIVILASGAVVAVSVTAAVCILMRNKKTKKEN